MEFFFKTTPTQWYYLIASFHPRLQFRRCQHILNQETTENVDGLIKGEMSSSLPSVGGGGNVSPRRGRGRESSTRPTHTTNKSTQCRPSLAFNRFTTNIIIKKYVALNHA